MLRQSLPALGDVANAAASQHLLEIARTQEARALTELGAAAARALEACTGVMDRVTLELPTLASDRAHDLLGE